MTVVATLLLAAGGASRFGAPKLLQEIDGRSLLARAVHTALDCAPGPTCVVLGSDAALLRPHCAGAQIVENRNWQEGLATSIGIGIRALPDPVGDVLILLADQVAIEARHLQKLWAAHAGHDGITSAFYSGSPGVPAVFSRYWFTALCALTGDQGAKRLMLAHPDALQLVDMSEAAIDIDTPADLESYRSLRAR